MTVYKSTTEAGIPVSDMAGIIEGCDTAARYINSQAALRSIGMHLLTSLSEAAKAVEPPTITTVLERLDGTEMEVICTILDESKLITAAPTTRLRALTGQILGY